MPPTDSSRPDSRRAYHRELISVARILRLTGLAFALIGAVGLLLGYEKGAWWLWPSWVSLFIGAVLIAGGVVSRVRHERKRPGEL
jgi:hypothetical protein